MRLIDADILLGYVNKYDRGQPIGKALRAMLEKSPTVDAIPIEFIEERISYLNELIDYEINEQGDWNGRSMHGQSELKLLLREWRTRNEID